MPDNAKLKRRWMAVAVNVASESEDTSRKVGAVIVDAEWDDQVSSGWNGLPRKINNLPERNVRPEKYLWFEHAERNAIYNAARKGRATEGCHIFQTLYPCCRCASGIIQSGIKKVITYEPSWNDATYAEEFSVTKQMFIEAGIEVEFIP